MQLIAMAMSKGDKGKHKNRYSRQPRPGDQQAETQSAMATQSRDDGVPRDDVIPRDAGLDAQITELSLPDSMDRQVENVPNLNIQPVEMVRHSSITPSVNRPVPHVHSANPPTSISTSQRDICTEDICSKNLPFQEQENHNNNNVTEAGNEFKINRTVDKTQSYLHVEISDQNISSISSHDQENVALFSSHMGPPQDILSGISEFMELEKDPLEVDENMNVTFIQNDQLSRLQPQPSLDWSKSLINTDRVNNLDFSLDVTARSEMSKQEQTGDAITTDDVHDQLFVSDLDGYEHSVPRFSNQQCCDLLQKCVSDDRRDLAISHSNNTLHRGEYLQFHGEGCTQRSRQLSDLNLWTVVDPPLWTSLALRENTTHCPEIVHVLPQSLSDQSVVCSDSYQRCRFVPVPEDECQGGDVETGRLSPLRYDNGALDNYVVQTCRLKDAENRFNHCVDEYNDGEDCQNNDESEEDFIERDNSFSVPLCDLDCITRMLPSTHIERDIVLNQMTDEEVTMFMYHPDDDEEEEAEEEELLVPYELADDITDEIRRNNPVATILEHGGNEHFLPIVSDVSPETNDSSKR